MGFSAKSQVLNGGINVDLLTLSLLLMFALLLSSIVAHYLPAVPVALVQIILGVIIAVMVWTLISETYHYYMWKGSGVKKPSVRGAARTRMGNALKSTMI